MKVETVYSWQVALPANLHDVTTRNTTTGVALLVATATSPV